MRIYKLFIINRIKRLLDKETHAFFKTIPLYLQRYFTVPRCELPQIKISVMKLELVQIFAARIVLSLAGRFSQARI